MNSSRKHPGIQAVKGPRIVTALRREITTGRLVPGSYLPHRQKLLQRFGVSMATIQGAIDTLVSEGFITATKRKGTVVVDHPPHLSHYALIFPDHPGDEAGWSPFFRMLKGRAQELSRLEGLTFRIYQAHHGDPHAEEFQGLCEDIRVRRLAGLIFAGAPYYLEGRPLLKNSPVPSSGFMDFLHGGVKAAVWFSEQSFIDNAVASLKQQGARRVAVLTGLQAGMQGQWLGMMAQALNQAGLVTRPEWVQATRSYDAHWTPRLVRLLLSGATAQRPDGLIICDDTLLEGATLGIRQANRHVPRDLKVVAHANFPLMTPNPMPFVRIGYRVREVFDLCMDLCHRQRRGEKCPPITLIESLCQNPTNP